MKYALRFLCLAALLFAVAGCMGQGGAPVGQEASVNATVTAQDLLHHRFELTAINGAALPKNISRTPTIEFNEGMRISGQTCNRFMGNGTLENGVLTVSEMASTMMMCVEPVLNELERDFSALLRGGAAVRLDGQTLTLSKEGYELTYTLRDLVQ